MLAVMFGFVPLSCNGCDQAFGWMSPDFFISGGFVPHKHQGLVPLVVEMMELDTRNVANTPLRVTLVIGRNPTFPGGLIPQ